MSMTPKMIGQYWTHFLSSTASQSQKQSACLRTTNKRKAQHVNLRPRGGAKASTPEWESGGQRGRKKHGALFGGRGEESFICGSLPGSPCERRERRETERRETERRERERGERDERDEKEMREMREMRERERQ